VQLAVGLAIARREPLAPRESVRGRSLVVTLTLAAAALATVGYLAALSSGPASIIVPLVATSPTIGGVLGIIALRERVARHQAIGIAIGLAAIVLLARPLSRAFDTAQIDRWIGVGMTTAERTF